MTFATGRGGAGNIHSNKNKTSENNIIQPTKSRNSPTPQQLQDSNGLQKVTSHNSKRFIILQVEEVLVTSKPQINYHLQN